MKRNRCRSITIKIHEDCEFLKQKFIATPFENLQFIFFGLLTYDKIDLNVIQILIGLVELGKNITIAGNILKNC